MNTCMCCIKHFELDKILGDPLKCFFEVKFTEREMWDWKVYLKKFYDYTTQKIQ